MGASPPTHRCSPWSPADCCPLVRWCIYAETSSLPPRWSSFFASRRQILLKSLSKPKVRTVYHWEKTTTTKKPSPSPRKWHGCVRSPWQLLPFPQWWRSRPWAGLVAGCWCELLFLGSAPWPVGCTLQRWRDERLSPERGALPRACPDRNKPKEHFYANKPIIVRFILIM